MPKVWLEEAQPAPWQDHPIRGSAMLSQGAQVGWSGGAIRLAFQQLSGGMVGGGNVSFEMLAGGRCARLGDLTSYEFPPAFRTDDRTPDSFTSCAC